MSSCDEREFALHPDRRGVRAAFEGVEVDPATDVIILSYQDQQEEYRGFPRGNLRDALYRLHFSGLPQATAVAVVRNGEEVFGKDEISDLFGSVVF